MSYLMDSSKELKQHAGSLSSDLGYFSKNIWLNKINDFFPILRYEAF